MTIPIALQLYTVRDVLAQDFEGTIRKVADMGYVGVETANLFGGSPASVSIRGRTSAPMARAARW